MAFLRLAEKRENETAISFNVCNGLTYFLEVVAGGGIEQELYLVLSVPKPLDLQQNQASTPVPQSKQAYQPPFQAARTISSVGAHLVVS
jgi:hypothetical protein